MALDPQEMTVSPLAPAVGWRVRRWLLETYPWPRGKAVARDLGVSLATAERILAGCDPKLKLFNHMVSLWQEPFLRFIYSECFEHKINEDVLVKESIERMRIIYNEKNIKHHYYRNNDCFQPIIRMKPLLAVTVLAARIVNHERTPTGVLRGIARVLSFVDVFAARAGWP